MATAAKKPVKKTAAKKASVKKTTRRAAAPAAQRVTLNGEARFMEAKFTEQTLYWIIIGAAVVGLAIWALTLQVQLNKMYDSIDATDASSVIRNAKQN